MKNITAIVVFDHSIQVQVTLPDDYTPQQLGDAIDAQIPKYLEVDTRFLSYDFEIEED